MDGQMVLVAVDGSEVFSDEMLSEAWTERPCLEECLRVARCYGMELGRLFRIGKRDVAGIVQTINGFAAGLLAEFDLTTDEQNEIRDTCAQVAATHSVGN